MNNIQQPIQKGKKSKIVYSSDACFYAESIGIATQPIIYFW
jgi:hypothetical protein